MTGKLILFSLLTCILQSCDPVYNTKIINNSDDYITVVFEYDRTIIQQNLDQKIRFKPELIINNENSNISFEIDEINFIVTSLVQSKDTLNLEMGIGTRPEFEDIKMITVFGTDTLNIDNIEKGIKAFKKKGEVDMN